VLDQHRLFGVVKNDVGLWVPSTELLFNFSVEVIFGVFGFPVAERNTQCMEERAVNITAVVCLCFELVLGNERQFMGSRPSFKQVFKGFPNYGLSVGARHLSQFGEIIEVELDE
jgi:hypothetical protein